MLRNAFRSAESFITARAVYDGGESKVILAATTGQHLLLAGGILSTDDVQGRRFHHLRDPAQYRRGVNRLRNPDLLLSQGALSSMTPCGTRAQF